MSFKIRNSESIWQVNSPKFIKFTKSYQTHPNLPKTNMNTKNIPLLRSYTVCEYAWIINHKQLLRAVFLHKFEIKSEYSSSDCFYEILIFQSNRKAFWRMSSECKYIAEMNLNAYCNEWSNVLYALFGQG